MNFKKCVVGKACPQTPFYGAAGLYIIHQETRQFFMSPCFENRNRIKHSRSNDLLRANVSEHPQKPNTPHVCMCWWVCGLGGCCLLKIRSGWTLLNLCFVKWPLPFLGEQLTLFTYPLCHFPW